VAFIKLGFSLYKEKFRECNFIALPENIFRVLRLLKNGADLHTSIIQKTIKDSE
jgi:hypothetical protein